MIFSRTQVLYERTPCWPGLLLWRGECRHVPRGSFSIEEVLSLLSETPTRIAALTDGLAPAQLRIAPSADEWSANDVLAHLRSCADVWGDYTRRILTEDKPTVRAINPRAWIERTDYPDLEFAPSLRAFTIQRADLLAVLEPLPPEGWARTATVACAGTPLQKTVLDYAERMARHERPHVKQIERIVETMRA
jgi:DinB superfamily